MWRAGLLFSLTIKIVSVGEAQQGVMTLSNGEAIDLLMWGSSEGHRLALEESPAPSLTQGLELRTCL